MNMQKIPITEVLGEKILNKAYVLSFKYEYKLGGKGKDTDGNGIPEVDCSYFVYLAIKESGLVDGIPGGRDKFGYKPTTGIPGYKYYMEVDKPQVGDFVLFKGHVGIYVGKGSVAGNGKEIASGNFFGAQSRRSGINFANFIDDTAIDKENKNMISNNKDEAIYWGDDINYDNEGKLEPKPFLGYYRLAFPVDDTDPNKNPIPPNKPNEPKPKNPPKDPLVLNLDGNGIQTLGRDAGIHFDFDGNGFKESTGWVAPGSGFLMLDRDTSESLNNGKELFGDFTPLPDGRLAVNGFQALAQFDENKDGKIDANDTIWSQLKVWQYDTEGEGGDLSDPDGSGIINTLDELGIKAIYLDSTITDITDESGNTETRAGYFEWTDGRTGDISEYRLQRDTGDTVPVELLDIPPDIAALPDADGYGNVYSLHQAMAREALSGQPSADSLKTLVEQFTTTTDITARNSLMEQILFKWTGADTAAPDARGPFMDGRKVVVLEKFYGDPPVNPNQDLAILWGQTYHKLFEIFYSRLMSQTHLKDLFDTITYTLDEDTFTVKGDLSGVITELQTRITLDPSKGKQDLGEFARTVRGIGFQDTVNYLSFRESFVNMNPDLGWTIDSGGLPVYDHLHQGQRTGSPHIEGTDGNDAVKGSLTQGDGYLNSLGGDDLIYGTERNEILINQTGDSILVAGGGNTSYIKTTDCFLN